MKILYMKYIFSFLLLLFLTFSLSAQVGSNVVSIYNADSTLVGTGILNNGLMEGLWKFENPQTKRLVQTISFNQGRREGVAISFYSNGNRNIEAEYRENRLNGIYRQYDSSGVLKLDMVFADSIAVGPYREYYGRVGQPDFFNPRQVKIEGQYANGKKHGKWVTFYNNGEIAIIQVFEMGVQEGLYQEYAIDGTLLVDVRYVNDRPHGPFTRFSYANLVQERGIYENGRKVGQWVSFFPGTKTVESEKNYDQYGNKTGEWKYYYENKRLARLEKYENDIPVGTWEEYFPNRTLSKKMTYELGLPVGEYIENHSNGKPSVNGQYKNGMKDGLWRSYFPEGNLYSIGEYRNDHKTGLWKYFNKIGILIAEGEYTLGSENGQWFYYYDGGQLKSVGSYFLGFEDGVWGLFYDNKQLTQEEFWSNGRLMNVGEYYSFDGSTTLEKGTLQDGDGTRFTYYTSGKRESEGNYRSGKPDGLWTYNHENGNKASEGNMVDGKKEGPWRYYNINGRLEQIINFKNDEIVTEDDEMRSEILFKFDN